MSAFSLGGADLPAQSETCSLLHVGIKRQTQNYMSMQLKKSPVHERDDREEQHLISIEQQQQDPSSLNTRQNLHLLE
jgi:hypothetical protein